MCCHGCGLCYYMYLYYRYMDILVHWITVFHVNTCYIGHCHSMYHYHYHTDTVTLDIIIPCSCTTNTRIRCYTRYRYTDTLYTIISYLCYIDSMIYICLLFLYSRCMDHYTCYMDSHVYMLSLFLSSCCPDHFSYYMIYYYMNIHVFLWHGYLIQCMPVFCNPDLDMILMLLDMLAIDIRCVKLSPTSLVSCFPLSCLMIS